MIPIQQIFIGDTLQQKSEKFIRGEYINMLGESYYKIHNFDALEPFFMSIVSSSNHWLFISSTGGLSAGRISAEQSLFPYYTEDKLSENNENTGCKAIFLLTRRHRASLWEPFSDRQQGIYSIERNLYKNQAGTVILFEEQNHSLGLIYQYAWRTGDSFGFVKTTWLMNTENSSCHVELLDGLQNILPANITSLTQNTFSCLLDAYKRSELNPQTGMAIYALNSTLTDLAEPSESLLSTTVFQTGLEPNGYLLSPLQLDHFRNGDGIETETEMRGQRGVYFVHTSLNLAPDSERSWHLVAEVNQDSVAIVRLSHKLQGKHSILQDAIERDITSNTSNLEKIVASADGVQLSNDPLRNAHHFANVMFNVMRGGVFADQYRIQKTDFIDFVIIHNRLVLLENQAFFTELPPELTISTLHERALATGVADLIRLSYTFMPLTFSRRHGDPSRPWNRFNIDIKNNDGSRKLGYEGNWRDIFQNWEALAISYPEFIESMIFTFLNATTLDGYNPYRITHHGIDWEIPEPNNPWANIGYWGDHQIIYLQKLMEISLNIHPGKLQSFLSHPIYCYANVPYRIKPYADIQKDPYNTIAFDWDLEHGIVERVQECGTDGKLVYTQNNRVRHVTLAEKLLSLLLGKLVNFIPEGGIWMNTQRPEWNDANNALVGKGISVVTLCYLRRYIVFLQQLIKQSALSKVQISAEILQLYAKIFKILSQFQSELNKTFSDPQRRSLMDALGQAGSDYRSNYYSLGLSGDTCLLPLSELTAFLDLILIYVDHTLRANKRFDDLYHAYNILNLGEGSASISRLYEMLEGQVAILSSGMLSDTESLTLLEQLRHSQLYRPDQRSYILYPDRILPGFLEKNCISPAQVCDLKIFTELDKRQDKTIFTRDDDGYYHFSGHIHNLNDVRRSLDALKLQPVFENLVIDEADKIANLFESCFHHSQFTGRSGSFFSYEGLGSIYWHMVSKLVLVVQEIIFRSRNSPSLGSLIQKYKDLCDGLPINKTPDIYGAFPSDPYSHTPKGHGARQPGMTGTVKEEILIRQCELGLIIKNGTLVFDFLLLDKNELLSNPTVFSYLSVSGQKQRLELPEDSLVYTLCQVPVILRSSIVAFIEVHFTAGSSQYIAGHVLDTLNSAHIFQRDHVIHHLEVGVIA